MTDVTLEQLKNHGIEPVPELIWDDPIYLRPALDYANGITYITVPGHRNVPKIVGKGKAAKETVEREECLTAITSDGRSFPYVEDRLAELGFTLPNNPVRPDTRRWSTTSIKGFIEGKATQPNPATLHQGIREVYEQYVEFAREEYYDILPLFIMGSYMFRLWRSLGYVHFNGTAASGKSQNLRILDALGFNTEWAAHISAAALYRTLAGFPGVILIDEAEGFEGERGEDLRRILNAGYLDGEGVKRAERGANDIFHVATFDTFGPKVLASINPLDNVIGSRCLVVLMRPALRKIPEFNRDDPRWQRIRDRLYLWTMFHSNNVAELIEKWNEETRYERAPDIISRQWQITQMYIVLADYIDQTDGGNRCDRLITFFNEHFAELQKQQDATDRIRIVLQALPRVLARQAPSEGGWFYLKSIHEVVSDYLEDDAREFYKTRNLAKHLDVLGFRQKRSSKQGTQIWLEPAQIRQEFHQRRVNPQPEDIEWLAGNVEYEHEIHIPEPTPELSVWDGPEEESDL